jgi:hypothetical protein
MPVASVSPILFATGAVVGAGRTKEMTMARTIGRAAAIVAVAIMLAGFGAQASGVAAEPLVEHNVNWNPKGFESTCKQAGGTPEEIQGQDPSSGHYSLCEFPDGGLNVCDWDRKTCTWGAKVLKPQTRTARTVAGNTLTRND